jgi:stage II sporulation protein GA (sporulation sigma-E factor processing peptidase)
MLGAALATVELFLRNAWLHIGFAAIFLSLLCIICCKSASVARKIKFLVSFYIAAFLISGAVNFVYGLLDRYLDGISLDGQNSTNRKAIVFSLIILLIIGVLRLFIMMFSETVNEKIARIRIEIGEKSLEVDALVDTGNLVKDPMNMNPVIFLKKSSAVSIIPDDVIELSNIDRLSTDFRRRIRLIPVTKNSETHVMTGVRADKVLLINDHFVEEIDATIVIDKEEGTFGGYLALTPYVALGNNV